MSEQIKTLTAEQRALRRAVAIAVLRDEGVAFPEKLADLMMATALAEKDNSEVTRDPVTGKNFTALELMDQMEAEGRERLGREFSERRGYTEAEIRQYEEYWELAAGAVMLGARLDDIQFANGIADGQLDVPPLMAAQYQLDRLAAAAVGQFDAGGDIAIWAHTDAHEAGVLASKFALDDPAFVNTHPDLAQAYRQGHASVDGDTLSLSDLGVHEDRHPQANLTHADTTWASLTADATTELDEESFRMSNRTREQLHQSLGADRAEMVAEIATDYLTTVMHTTDRLVQPVAVILVAQPGAGSPAVIHELQEDYRLKGGFIVIDRDLLREQLPYVDDSLQSRTGPAVDADTNHLVDAVLQEGMRLKRNLVVEPASNDPEAAGRTAKLLRQGGYRVELHALAVNDQISYERATAQFERDRQYNAVTRAVSHDFHDKAFQGASTLLRRLEFSAAVDRVVVYNRLQDVVYDHAPIQGTATAVKHFDNARNQLTTYERLSLASHWDNLSENLAAHQLDAPQRSQAQMALERAHYTLRRSRDAAQHYDMQFPMRTAESQALGQAYAARLADAFRQEDRRLANTLPELKQAYAAKDHLVANGSPAGQVGQQIADMLAQGRMPKIDTLDPVEREWERLKKQLRDVTDSIQIVRASGMPLDARDRKELTDAQRDLNDFLTKNSHLLTRAERPGTPAPEAPTPQQQVRAAPKPG